MPVYFENALLIVISTSIQQQQQQKPRRTCRHSTNGGLLLDQRQNAVDCTGFGPPSLIGQALPQSSAVRWSVLPSSAQQGRSRTQHAHHDRSAPVRGTARPSGREGDSRVINISIRVLGGRVDVYWLHKPPPCQDGGPSLIWTLIRTEGRGN